MALQGQWQGDRELVAAMAQAKLMVAELMEEDGRLAPECVGGIARTKWRECPGISRRQ